MKFAYTILYVNDVIATVVFYEKAFGLQRRMVHETDYAEMETGATRIAFAARQHVRTMLNIDLQATQQGSAAPPFELGLVVPDVAAAFGQATAAGAAPVAEPATKPWGQTVAYVQDINGFLVELCSAMD